MAEAKKLKDWTEDELRQAIKELRGKLFSKKKNPRRDIDMLIVLNLELQKRKPKN